MRTFGTRVLRVIRTRWAAGFAVAYPVLFLAAGRVALAASPTLDQAAVTGPTSLGTALNGVQGLLYHIALPVAGVGLATGGVWHSVSHQQQAQEQSKTLMKASLVGAGVTVLASALIGAFSKALGA